MSAIDETIDARDPCWHGHECTKAGLDCGPKGSTIEYYPNDSIFMRKMRALGYRHILDGFKS